MAFEQILDLSEELQQEIELKCSLREKFILLPIADKLGIERSQLEMLKYEPDQICGIIISSIQAALIHIERLEKKNKKLVQEKESRGQQVLDFISRFDKGGNSV